MNKFTIELTSEQLVILSAVITAVWVRDISKLELSEETSVGLMKTLQSAKFIGEIKEEPVIQKQEQQITKAGFKVPEEFFDTYNMYIEEGNTDFLIDDEENLRFIYGKQGQMGIEYWAYYDEGKKADTAMFIKNSDMQTLAGILKEILLALKSSNSDVNFVQTVSDKYQLNVTRDTLRNKFSCILYKRNNNDSIDMIPFENEKQLELFYSFSEYHLNV